MINNVAIVCNGLFPKKEYPRHLIRTADFIICCDGALNSFLRNSKAIFGEVRNPDIVIGDLDSLPANVAANYQGKIIKVSEQETNDQSKAVRYVLENLPDVSSIHILGATGKREDHTIGNLSLLMEYAREYDLESRGIYIDAVSDYSSAFAITDSTEIGLGKGRRISIFCPDNSLRICSEGLEWRTDDVVFDNWWKATLNRTTKDTVKLKFSHKSIALILTD